MGCVGSDLKGYEVQFVTTMFVHRDDATGCPRSQRLKRRARLIRYDDVEHQPTILAFLLAEF